MMHAENFAFKKGDALLCLVTDRNFKNSAKYLDFIDAALDGGVNMVQLRDKPLASSRIVYEEGLKLRSLCKERKVCFVLNDRLDLALALDADGLHLGQEDLPPSLARTFLPAKCFIGLSVSNLAEATSKEAQFADYLGFGAVYPTNTKPEAAAGGLEELKKVYEAVKIPLIAIGGLNLENSRELVNTGCRGLALVSALWNSDDVKKTAQAFREILENPSF